MDANKIIKEMPIIPTICRFTNAKSEEFHGKQKAIHHAGYYCVSAA
jgi:hypothetical protein